MIAGVLLAEGTMVGPFCVGALLARGGFGSVYVASDIRLGRRVALKLIERADRPDAAITEARAAARVVHPNIVTVFDVGEHDGRPYVAFELIEGKTLRARLDRGPPELERALEWLAELASALAAAHRQDVLHLDLTPRNILVGEDGRAKIVDFGLAKDANDTAAATNAGTPGYVAPERSRGARPGPWCDVWSFGVLIRELLELHAHAPAAALVLAEECTALELAKRPTADQISERLRRITAPHVQPESEPFRGLAPLDEQAAERLLGRDEELAAFFELLPKHRVIGVAGASGAGKSSFLRAGVASRLRARGSAVVTVRPGRTPFFALAEAVAALSPAFIGSTLGVDRPSTHSTSELARRWRERPERLGAELAELAAALGRPVVLIVDQLEELETLAEAEERAAAASALFECANDRRVQLIFGLRDDFLGRISSRLHAAPALGHIFALGTPRRSALRAALEAPVIARGYRFEPGLLDAVIEEIEKEPAALSLLQVAGRALWERRDRERRMLTEKSWRALGGVAGSLAVHGDRALEATTPEELDAARRMLVPLIAADGTRRPITRARMLEAEPAAASAILDRLIDARVLTARRGFEDEELIELTHEVLAERWPALRNWLDQTRGERAFSEELSFAAERWRRLGRPDAELWGGDALAEARRRLDRHRVSIAAPAREFLERSESRAARRRRRKQIGVASFLLASVALGVVFFAGWRFAARQAALAELRAADALVEAGWSALNERDLARARALLAGAEETSATASGRALRWRLALEPELWRYEHNVPIEDATFLANGEAIALVGQSAEIVLAGASTGSTRVVGAQPDIVLAVAASPRAPEIVTAGNDGRLLHWAASAGAGRLAGTHAAPIQAVAFSADGRAIVSGDAEGIVTVRAIDGGETSWSKRIDAGVYGAQFSGDHVWVADSRGVLWSIAREDSPLLVERGVTALARDRRGTVWAGTAQGELLELDQRAVVTRRSIHRAAISALAADLRIATAGRDQLVCVTTAAGEEVFRETLTGAPASAIALDDHFGRLAIMRGGSVRALQIDQPRLPANSGSPSVVMRVAFAAGDSLLLASGEDGWLRSYRVDDGAPQAAVDTAHGAARALLVRDDQTTVLTGGDDGRLRVWNADRLAAGEVLGGHRGAINDLAESPDRRWIASASQDHTIRLWREHQASQVLDAEAPVVAVVFTSSRVVALTDDRRIVAWTLDPRGRLGERELLWRASGNTPDLIALPSGQLLLLGGPPLVILNANTRAVRSIDLAPLRLYGAALSTSGQIATIGVERYGAISALDGRSSVRLTGHRWAFWDVAFSRSGELLATAGEDGLAGLWRARDGTFVWGEGRPSAPIIDETANAARRSAPTLRRRWRSFDVTGHSDGLITVELQRGRRVLEARIHGAIDSAVERSDALVLRSITGGSFALPAFGLSADVDQ